MSNLQQVIARLLSDHTFRIWVQNDPRTALQRYNLTADELACVIELDLEQWDSDPDRRSHFDFIGIQPI